MTDDSDIVIRWEVNDATARFATGKVESEEFYERGFKWTAAVVRSADDEINFALRCVADHDGPWKCDAEVDVKVLNSDAIFEGDWVEKNAFCFDQNCSDWIENTEYDWDCFTGSFYNINDKVIIEYRIRIISSERIEVVSNNFVVPNEMSNVILKIGEKELHVSKEYLAVHSPVFKTLFFGEFAEKGKEEIEIKDVVYEEFLDLLQFIYVDTVEITDRNVLHILKLADRFQMERVLNQSAKFLMKSNGFDVMKKLLLADQYRLASIKDHYLKSFNSTAEISAEIMSSPDCANFSAEMKAAIYDRYLQLNLH